MSLWALLQAYKPILTIIFILFAPSLPRLVLNTNTYLRRRPSTRSPPSPPSPPLFKGALALHTGWYLLQLLYPPYDLFISSHLPLMISNATLRQIVLGPQTASAAGGGLDGTATYPLQELLLQKLQNLDTRITYFRYGHETVLNCVWCTSHNDYSLFALPTILAPYIVEILLVGTLSLQMIGGPPSKPRAMRWRGMLVWIIVGMAVGEVGIKYAADMRVVRGDTTRVSYTAHLSA